MGFRGFEQNYSSQKLSNNSTSIFKDKDGICVRTPEQNVVVLLRLLPDDVFSLI